MATLCSLIAMPTGVRELIAGYSSCLELARCVLTSRDVMSSLDDSSLWQVGLRQEVPFLSFDDTLFRSPQRRVLLECYALLRRTIVAVDTSLSFESVRDVENLIVSLRGAWRATSSHLHTRGHEAHVVLGEFHIGKGLPGPTTTVPFNSQDGPRLAGLTAGTLQIKLGLHASKLMVNSDYFVSQPQGAPADASRSDAVVQPNTPLSVNIVSSSSTLNLAFRGAPLTLNGVTQSADNGIWATRRGCTNSFERVPCVLTVLDGAPIRRASGLSSALHLDRVRRPLRAGA